MTEPCRLGPTTTCDCPTCTERLEAIARRRIEIHAERSNTNAPIAIISSGTRFEPIRQLLYPVEALRVAAELISLAYDCMREDAAFREAAGEFIPARGWCVVCGEPREGWPGKCPRGHG